jgi:hypothetical protein
MRNRDRLLQHANFLTASQAGFNHPSAEAAHKWAPAGVGATRRRTAGRQQFASGTKQLVLAKPENGQNVPGWLQSAREGHSAATKEGSAPLL